MNKIDLLKNQIISARRLMKTPHLYRSDYSLYCRAKDQLESMEKLLKEVGKEKSGQ